jgi:hypothetical protein
MLEHKLAVVGRGDRMPDFEIYFHGLICHFAPESRTGNASAPKTMALFVRDDEHERMVVDANDNTHFAGFNSISMTVTGGTTGVIDSTDAGFQRNVPHLGSDDISRSGALVDPTLAIALTYPPVAGRLAVAQLYANKGDYQLGQRNTVRDVARITLLTITAETLAITCDGSTLMVDPAQPWMTIANNSQVGGVSTVGNMCGNHFRRYSFIMRAPTGDLTNCAAVAHVVDHDSPSVPLQNGLHIAAVESSAKLKPLNETPFVVPFSSVHQPLQPHLAPSEPDQRVDREIFHLDPESAARHLHPGTHVLTQTQCSNTNWP